MKTKSFLRREEYKRLAKTSIDGAVLDIGGSIRSGYHQFLKGEHTITTCNIDASYGADTIFDAQDLWPFPDSSVDGVLFINVLEHLYHYERAVAEAVRVLRPGGRVIGVVPFMFNVHGSPSDYFRYTKSTIERTFSDYGFSRVDVEELGTGAFSVAYHVLIGFVVFHFMATPLIAIARFLDTTIARMKPNNLMSAKYMPLGYYFEATK